MDERDKLISELIKEKGGTKEQYLSVLNKIAFHESGGTMDPTIKQVGGGPGRGKYQFEEGRNEGAITAARRTKRYLQQKGMEVPEWLNKATQGNSLDASTLTSEQQDVLFLGNMRMHPKADLGRVINGDESVADFWANYHWAGSDDERGERINAFKDSIQRYANVKPQSKVRGNNFFSPKKVTADQRQEAIAVQDNIPTPSEIQQPQQWLPIQEKLAAAQAQPQQPKAPNELLDTSIYKGVYDYVASKKQFNEYNGGGKHEENPLGGIPVGIGPNGLPNTVEEGETSYNFGDDTFVFSDRIAVNDKAQGKNFNQPVINNTFAKGGTIDPPAEKDPLLRYIKDREKIGPRYNDGKFYHAKKFDYNEDLGFFKRNIAKLMVGEENLNKIQGIYNQLVDFKNKRPEGAPMSAEEKDLRERILKAQMFGYPADASELEAFANRVEQGKEQPMGIRPYLPHRDKLREALNRKYYGLDYSESLLRESNYRPSKATDANAKYTDFNEADRRQAIKALKNNYSNFEDLQKRFRNGSQVIKYKDLMGDNIILREEADSPLTQLQNFTMGSGEDDNGRYVSYYDKWDLELPGLEKVNINEVNNPYEIYGRIYEKDYNSFALGGPTDPPTKKDPRYLTVKTQDNTSVGLPQMKAGSNTLLNEYLAQQKDKKELHSTGTIAQPKSVAYKQKPVEPTMVKQDNRPEATIRENAKIANEIANSRTVDLLEMPLVYGANPLKAVGDAYGLISTEKRNPFPTSKEDAQEIVRNRYFGNKNSLEKGLEYVPEMAINLATEGIATKGATRKALSKYFNKLESRAVNEVAKPTFNLTKGNIDEALINDPQTYEALDMYMKRVAKEMEGISGKISRKIQKDIEAKYPGEDLNEPFHASYFDKMRLFNEYKQQIDDNLEEIVTPKIKKYIELQTEYFNKPETRKKIEGLGMDPDAFIQHINDMKLSTKWHEREGSAYNHGLNAMRLNINDIDSPYGNNDFSNWRSVIDHEIGHSMQGARGREITKLLRAQGKYPDHKYAETYPTRVDEMAGLLKSDVKAVPEEGYDAYAKAANFQSMEDAANDPIWSYSYFDNAGRNPKTDGALTKLERLAHLREFKSEMQNAGLIKDFNDNITVDMIREFKKLAPKNRILQFATDTDKNYRVLSQLLNKTPIAVGAIATGAATLKNNSNGK